MWQRVSSRHNRPPNNEMQRTSPFQHGGSPLISVLGGPSDSPGGVEAHVAHLRPRPGIALQVAEWHHIAMAAIVLLVLAMEVHLWAIDASGDVVGGGAFLLTMWLGLPAVYLGIAILYHSLKASDTQLRALTALLISLVCAALFEARLLLVNSLAVSYVGLVAIRVWLHWRRARNLKGAL